MIFTLWWIRKRSLYKIQQYMKEVTRNYRTEVLYFGTPTQKQQAICATHFTSLRKLYCVKYWGMKVTLQGLKVKLCQTFLYKSLGLICSLQGKVQFPSSQTSQLDRLEEESAARGEQRQSTSSHQACNQRSCCSCVFYDAEKTLLISFSVSALYFVKFDIVS